MHAKYDDILSRIPEAPQWYDEHGTPRYGTFTPANCPSIYAHHVGLFRIACQSCGRTFDVEMHGDVFDKRLARPPSKWHYGDPPIHGCVGDTMNCEDLAVLEFWTREVVEPWVRRLELEGPIDEQEQLR